MVLALLVAVPVLLSASASAFGWWPFSKQYDVKLTAFDQVAQPGEAVILRAKLEHHGKFGVNPDMRGYPLRFHCPPLIDREVRTEADGIASAAITIPVDADAVYPIKVSFPGSDHHRPGESLSRLFVWPKDARILITDVDLTISGLAELRVPFTANDKIPTLPGAVEELTELSKRYRVVYLSARDDLFCNRTCDWLRGQCFPEGPFFCRDIYIGSKQETFKREFIADLKKRFPGVSVGVGDKPTDAGAYVSNGLQTFIIAPKRPDKLPKEAMAVESWREVRQRLMTE